MFLEGQPTVTVGHAPGSAAQGAGSLPLVLQEHQGSWWSCPQECSMAQALRPVALQHHAQEVH